MTDTVTLLRNPPPHMGIDNWQVLCAMAADEIERLRVALRCISQRTSYGPNSSTDHALRDIREWADAALNDEQQESIAGAAQRLGALGTEQEITTEQQTPTIKGIGK